MLRTPSRLPLLLCLLVGGCASGGPIGPPLPVTPRSLADDYILVHGMAAGALTADGVDEASYGEMVRLDHDALLAVGESVTSPGNAAAQDRATATLRRLADYASVVGDGTPSPPPDGSGRARLAP